MQGVFPVDEAAGGLTGTNAKIMQLNEMLKVLAKEKDHKFINLQTLFLDDENKDMDLLHNEVI